MRSFAIGKSKLHEDLGVLVDYLDYIGPEKAFHVDRKEDGDASAEAGAEADDTPPSGPHGDAYEDIGTMVSGCGT